MLIAPIVIFGILIVLVLIVVGVYNRLVRLRNRFKNAFAQIDVQLKRRYDLIPNLVETAKGYLSHERETLEAVIKARGIAVAAAGNAARKPGDPGAMNELNGAENMLTATLGKLFALSEAYPNLKADQTMLQLMEDLRSTENRIAFSRQSYNDSVNTYNIARESFPAVLFAGTFGFTVVEFLDATLSEEERQAPKVEF
ncbi:MAG: LemA family protein [bacterium]|nr:LemA family protein [bacterium]